MIKKKTKIQANEYPYNNKSRFNKQKQFEVEIKNEFKKATKKKRKKVIIMKKNRGGRRRRRRRRRRNNSDERRRGKTIFSFPFLFLFFFQN